MWKIFTKGTLIITEPHKIKLIILVSFKKIIRFPKSYFNSTNKTFCKYTTDGIIVIQQCKANWMSIKGMYLRTSTGFYKQCKCMLC